MRSKSPSLQVSQSMKPTIPAAEVEKAEAVAGFAAGQQARAKGLSPAALAALGGHGQKTRVNDELELLPLGLQVQLCLMEHAALFESLNLETSNSELLQGLKRLTRLAYIFSDPEAAYSTLTLTADDAEKRRFFDNEAFALAKHFNDADSIDLLNGHISKEMGLLEAANPALPVITEKKTRREKPLPRRR
jgi:hypothetical protein